MMKSRIVQKVVGLILVSLLPFFADAQLGGRHVFKQLDLAPSARISALGGSLIAVKDGDVALAFGNPSSLNASMHQAISFNHSIHFAGIQQGYIAYGHHQKSTKMTFHAGLQYVSYGKFTSADETGMITGDFQASGYTLKLGVGKQLSDRIAVGANLNILNSRLESYNSFGLATDLAATYQVPEKPTIISFVIRNLGFQINPYNSLRERLPLDIQLGISNRLKHLPFRFSIIIHHLNRYNILYDNPADAVQSIFDDQTPRNNGVEDFVDNFFRHFIFNGEFLLGKHENLRLRLGYNHLRRGELTVKGLRSLAGFNFGLGIKISKFRIDYGWSGFHLVGGYHHFSISTSISSFKGKK